MHPKIALYSLYLSSFFQAYFARIEEVNHKGPHLRAVLETSPTALQQASVLDQERQTKGTRGPLHGIPILLKDNIATNISDGKPHCPHFASV